MLVSKACLMQVLYKRFSPAKRLHATVKVGVCRFISTDDPSNPRKDTREVQIIKGTHEAVRRIRELEYRHLSSGFEYAVHLLKSRIEVTEIAASEGASHSIKRRFLKRHFLRIPVREVHIQFALCALRLTDSHHFIREVQSGNCLRFGPTEHLDGQIGGTDGYVQDMLGGLHMLDRLAPPTPVDIQGQPVIQTVVGTGDAVE